ncbi:sorting and assembly machinery component 50 homolog B-like [Oscarella lobularis]|uniref:sorting and assembly machinery component 50 homolog B-like n=1 Tax=Oscarella lobularis TaxID=121494 RepID=UPI00331448C0
MENLSKVDIGATDIVVKTVHVNGVDVTRNDVIKDAVEPLFSASTFNEVLKSCMMAKKQLHELGIFQTISVLIDSNYNDVGEADGLEVVMNVKECNRLLGKVTSTIAQNNELQGLASLTVRNVFGRAEMLEMKVSSGRNVQPRYEVLFKKPIHADKDHNVTLSVHRAPLDFPSSGYKEVSTGLSAQYALPTQFGDHAFKYNLDWRHRLVSSKATPFAVRQHAGHSIKSSIGHTFTIDSRPETVFPKAGSLFQFTQEYAGLGGDVKYAKCSSEVQTNVPLPWESTLTAALSGGLLKWFGQRNISDGFFLGGPLSVRGFSTNGLGPQDQGYSLGADAFWASGLHLFTPLPYMRPSEGGIGSFFRAHFFLTAGNCDSLTLDRREFWNFFTQMRWSYGAGLALRLGPARIELNYCIPKSSQPTDVLHTGHIQVGFGLHYSC